MCNCFLKHFRIVVEKRKDKTVTKRRTLDAKPASTTRRCRTMPLLAACCAMAALSAIADADPYEGYVRLNGQDTENNLSWAKGTRWSDKAAPSPGKNYYVPEN